MKLHTGDTVLVTAGKDKGKKAPIERVFPKKDRVVVSGVNIYKKARKGFAGQKGGIVEFSRPLPVASVALICPHCAKQTRVSFRIDNLGTKSRICVKCKTALTIAPKDTE
ncbi:MAG: 50S ribosomal protein L24 [bacterium]|nr:50S ribosomal protein L24 [bacterium]